MSDESGSSREACPICGETACVCDRAIPKMGAPPKRLLPQSGKGRGRGRGKDTKPEPSVTSMEDVTEVEDNFEKQYIPYSPLQRLANTAADQPVEEKGKKDKKAKGKEKTIKREEEDESYSAYSPLQKLDAASTSAEEQARQIQAAQRAELRRKGLNISTTHEPDKIDLNKPRDDDDSDREN